MEKFNFPAEFLDVICLYFVLLFMIVVVAIYIFGSLDFRFYFIFHYFNFDSQFLITAIEETALIPLNAFDTFLKILVALSMFISGF